MKKYHYYYWFAFPVPKGVAVDTVASFQIPDQFSEEKVKIVLHKK